MIWEGHNFVVGPDTNRKAVCAEPRFSGHCAAAIVTLTAVTAPSAMTAGPMKGEEKGAAKKAMVPKASTPKGAASAVGAGLAAGATTSGEAAPVPALADCAKRAARSVGGDDGRRGWQCLGAGFGKAPHGGAQTAAAGRQAGRCRGWRPCRCAAAAARDGRRAADARVGRSRPARSERGRCVGLASRLGCRRRGGRAR